MRAIVLEKFGGPDNYDIGGRKKAAWSYPQAWTEVARVSNLVSFEPGKIDEAWILAKC